MNGCWQCNTSRRLVVANAPALNIISTRIDTMPAKSSSLTVRIRKDLTGKRFGRLLCLEAVSRSITPNGTSVFKWRCQCDCGKECNVTGQNLRRGYTRSCGCLLRESVKYGSITHGMRRTPTYKVWAGIIQRCTNPNEAHYKDYGGRGIGVCDRWLNSFENFLEDMGEKPPGLWIERTDNNKGYEPGNCRWATIKEQANNKRNNRKITAFGKTQTLAQWSDEIGIGASSISARIMVLGWTPERAVSAPLRGMRGVVV